MPLFYQSGEEIQAGDRVRLHGELGQVDFVRDSTGAEPGGVMILEPKLFGRLFIPAPVDDYEDLELSRAAETG